MVLFLKIFCSIKYVLLAFFITLCNIHLKYYEITQWYTQDKVTVVCGWSECWNVAAEW
jgi:hypothetical protein